MDSLQQLCGAAFSLHYVLLLAAANFPKVLFDHFVRQLESFLFYYIFTKTPTKDLERNFSIWADELREIGETVDPKVQNIRLNEFVTERLQKSMDGKDPELSDTLKRYVFGSMQQYRTRYLLAKLTQQVEMAFKGINARGSLAEFTTLQIEHILPDNPEPELRQSFSGANPGKSYDEYKVRLGNLTLLEKPINIVASNGFFDKKKTEYASSGNYLTRSIAGLSVVGKNSSITRVTRNYTRTRVGRRRTSSSAKKCLIALGKDVWRTALIAVN
jgi:hypothetical protein